MTNTINKLKFKGSATVINAPAMIAEAFIHKGFKTALDKKIKNSNTLVFINNRKEFLYFLNNDLKYIEPDSVLWFAYPKGTSKIKTDINRDSLRALGEEFGITTVTAVSIDETWSALRFRPVDKVGK
ncbi:MAG: hypothetical protein ACTHK0_10355 [Ginsengibacter sp.]